MKEKIEQIKKSSIEEIKKSETQKEDSDHTIFHLQNHQQKQMYHALYVEEKAVKYVKEKDG